MIVLHNGNALSDKPFGYPELFLIKQTSGDAICQNKICHDSIVSVYIIRLACNSEINYLFRIIHVNSALFSSIIPLLIHCKN
jgi:hypothetical protein